MVTSQAFMFIQRYYLDCLSDASYLIADEDTKQAAVIDPQRDVDIYVEDAKRHGWQIKWVILTHFHADFIAGNIELRDLVGAKIVLGERAEAEFDHQKLADGASIEMGDVRLEVMETPGHTPEGLTVLAFDKAKSNKAPVAAFTGDTLFIGDVGRPDLLASIGVTADELAAMLYDSIQRLLQLPDATLVYPAHGAGTMCGKALSDATFSTIGEQKKYNYALQPMSKSKFMQLVEADQPEAPGYFVHDAILNRKERESLDASMSDTMPPLTVDQVVELQKSGAQLLDTRDPAEFAGAHFNGAINIGVDGKYATWAGTVLDKELPIVVIADEDRVAESIMRLGRIGFNHVAGYLGEGMNALIERPELIAKVQRVAPATVPEPSGTAIVDVRSEKEHQGGILMEASTSPSTVCTTASTNSPTPIKLWFIVQAGTDLQSPLAYCRSTAIKPSWTWLAGSKLGSNSTYLACPAVKELHARPSPIFRLHRWVCPGTHWGRRWDFRRTAAGLRAGGRPARSGWNLLGSRWRHRIFWRCAAVVSR